MSENVLATVRVVDRGRDGVEARLDLQDWPASTPDDIAAISFSGATGQLDHHTGVLARALVPFVSGTLAVTQDDQTLVATGTVTPPRPVRSRQPVSDEVLAEVARTYRDAPDGDRIPALRRARAEVSDSTLYRWIRAARERGLLEAK